MYSKKEITKGVRLLTGITKRYKDEDPATVAEGIFSYFAQRNKLGLLKKVLRAYQKKTVLTKKVEVTVAHKFDDKFIKMIERNAALLAKNNEKTLKSEEFNITVKTDPSIIGGFTVKTLDYLFDFSIKNGIESL